jgi:predicted RNA-binding Zn-ribbon protein involved in translation (DUF1610 family)
MTTVEAKYITTKLVAVTCPNCGLVFGLGDGHVEALQRSKGSFSCPSCQLPGGWYGPSAAEKERDRLAADLRWKAQQLETERARRATAEASARALKGAVTKARKRATAGVCPHCTRSFENVRVHMTSKHPEWKP